LNDLKTPSRMLALASEERCTVARWPQAKPPRWRREMSHAASPLRCSWCRVALKRAGRCRARDLYISAWFRKARAYVEGTKMPWFILSAEHGLLHPDTEVEPYERTLNRMPAGERREWARRVGEALVAKIAGAQHVIVLAGERYREFLMPYLTSICPDVQVPMEGMRIGEQLQWLGANTGADSEPHLGHPAASAHRDHRDRSASSSLPLGISN